MSIKVISPGLLKTYIAIKESPNWLTADGIAEISKTKPDTVRKHVRYLSREKVLEVLEVHPAYYYRLSQNLSDIWVVQQLEALLATIKI